MKTLLIATDMPPEIMRMFDVDEEVAQKIGLREHPGYMGVFTRQQETGAVPNERRVVKVKCDAGDTRPMGALGTVLGSMHHPVLGLAYFVEWDDHPKCAVFISAWKIAEAGR